MVAHPSHLALMSVKEAVQHTPLEAGFPGKPAHTAIGKRVLLTSLELDTTAGLGSSVGGIAPAVEEQCCGPGTMRWTPQRPTREGQRSTRVMVEHVEKNGAWALYCWRTTIYS